MKGAYGKAADEAEASVLPKCAMATGTHKRRKEYLD
jgi:hypothetical protein